MIERARGIGSERTPGKPRCVLVVRIERAGRVSYWFEIETRPTEGGVLSPYFYDLGQDDQEVIQHLIESIARAEGVQPPASCCNCAGSCGPRRREMLA